MLAGLISATQENILHRVVTFKKSNDFFSIGKDIVTAIGALNPIAPLRLGRALGAEVCDWRPDVVHAWMYHANLLTMAIRNLGARIVWSIHNSDLHPRTTKLRTRLVNRTTALLSARIPDAVVYVAAEVRRLHEAQGYAPSKGLVIPNGIDAARFQCPPRPPGAGQSRLWVLALVGRYDPQKGHHFLIDVLAKHPHKEALQIILVGRGCDTAEPLRDHLQRAGLAERTLTMGAIPDIERIYAAADIVILPALYGEAMPLTLLEAAAAGCAICASRVGGIGSLALPRMALFDPNDAAGCAAALTRTLQLTAENEAQPPFPEEYRLSTTAARYEELYRVLLSR